MHENNYDYLLPYDKWMLSGYEIMVLQYWFCEIISDHAEVFVVLVA